MSFSFLLGNDNQYHLTGRQFLASADRVMAHRLRVNNFSRREIAQLMPHRSPSFVYASVARMLANPEDLFPRAKSGRPRKITPTMLRSTLRNFTRNNKKSKKSARKMAAHFEISSETSLHVVPVSEYVLSVKIYFAAICSSIWRATGGVCSAKTFFWSSCHATRPRSSRRRYTTRSWKLKRCQHLYVEHALASFLLSFIFISFSIFVLHLLRTQWLQNALSCNTRHIWGCSTLSALQEPVWNRK